MKILFLFHFLLVTSYAQTYVVGDVKISLNNGYCFGSCASAINNLSVNNRLYVLDQIKRENPKDFKSVIWAILRAQAIEGESGDFIQMRNTYRSVYGKEYVSDDLTSLYKAKNIEIELELSDDREYTRKILTESFDDSGVSKHLDYSEVFYQLYQSNDPVDKILLKEIFQKMINHGNSSVSSLLMDAYYDDLDITEFLVNSNLSNLEKVYCEVLENQDEGLSEYWFEECSSRNECYDYIFSHFKEWGDMFEQAGVTSCKGRTAYDWAQDFFDGIDDPSYFDENYDETYNSTQDFANTNKDCYQFKEEPFTFLVRETDLHFKVLLNAINCEDSFVRENLADFFYRYGVKAMTGEKRADVQYSYMKGVKDKCHFYLEAMSTEETNFSRMHPFSIEGAYESLVSILEKKERAN